MAKKRKNILIDKLFLLNWKKVLFLVALWVVCVILHNAFYAIFGFEEAFFFILAVVLIPFYGIISLIYSLIKFVAKRF